MTKDQHRKFVFQFVFVHKMKMVPRSQVCGKFLKSLILQTNGNKLLCGHPPNSTENVGKSPL